MTDKKKVVRGVKSVKTLTDEDIAEMGSTGVYLSLSLSVVVYECYMAGLPLDELLEGIKMLYAEISKQIKEEAN